MSSVPDYSFRDAGLHSRALRVLNRVGGALSAVGIRRPSLEPNAIIAAARKQSGLEDLGSETYREPLEILRDCYESEARLTTFGRMAASGLLSGALANRMKVLDWANKHPEVREQKIERPWIILGLPRTGTSLLSILMGLDPRSRPLLQWEASTPIPPPDLATGAEDPRIAEVQKSFAQLQAVNPPIGAMHPFGATLATECVTLLVFDLRALSIETQALIPSYGLWLEQTDMTDAYGWHELTLQILQSKLPTESWVLKTPNHLWCIDQVRARYPDARLIWTHRDPSKVVASVASLNTSMQRAFSDSVDPIAVAKDWNRKLHGAVTRGVEFDRARSGSDWCCHVQYSEIMKDPLGSVRRIYSHFGAEVMPLHERRMQTWMEERPQEVFGRHRYDPADFDLTTEGIREQYSDYRRRFDVPDE